jgi:Leucine-rich repeat (LRR) protein
MKEAQKFLERKYPKYFRKDVKKLDISNRSLEGELDLTDFSNLEELNCSTNALTKIDLKNCRKLKILKCSHNSLGLGQNKLMGLDLTGLENLQEL